MKVIIFFTLLSFICCTQKKQHQLNPETIDKLRSKLHHKNKYAKIDASEKIASLGEVAYKLLPDLEKNLSHPDNDVRSYTILAVGKIGPKAENLIPALVQNLTVDNRQVCQNAAWALNNLGLQKASDAFLKYLKDLVPKLEDPKSIPSRIDAAKKYGCLGTHGELSVSVLGERLLYDTSPTVRKEAAKSLGLIGSREAIPYLEITQKLWVGDFAELAQIDPQIFFGMDEINFYVYTITKNGIELIIDKTTTKDGLEKIKDEKAYITKMFVPKKNIFRKNIHGNHVPAFRDRKKEIGKTSHVYISNFNNTDYTQVLVNLFPKLIKPYFIDRAGTFLEPADFVREEAKRALELINR